MHMQLFNSKIFIYPFTTHFKYTIHFFDDNHSLDIYDGCKMNEWRAIIIIFMTEC